MDFQVSNLNRRKLYSCGAVLLLALVAGIVLWSERDPVVDGQSATKWALQYSQWVNYPPKGTNFAASLQKLGKEAVPSMARLLHAYEPPWVTKFILWSRKQRWLPLRFDTAEEKRTAGLYGLSVLGSNVAPMLEQIVAYKPHTNSPEQGALHALVGALARKEAEPRVPSLNELFLSRLTRSEIFRINSADGVRYVAMGWWRGNSIPGSSFMSISLLEPNASRLDWFEIGRSTRSGDLILARANAGTGYDFLITTDLHPGDMHNQLKILTRTTNLFLVFEELNAMLGIRIEGDQFKLTAEHTSENPFRPRH
jgi:hypothetical protein